MTVLIVLLAYVGQGTFSIVAVDPQTGELGIAVASKVFDVGYIVPWLKAGVGAVATQANANPYIGPWVLEALDQGKSADEALAIVMEKDSLIQDRQVGIVDRDGRSTAFTGKHCLDWAGHVTAPNVSIQGNILVGPAVLDSMLAVFERTKGPLAERLMAALEAGDAAGGDKRGKQSAAIIVVRKGGGYAGVDERLVDLKVVDNPEPIRELRRQYETWQYIFLAPAYLRLAEEEKTDAEIFLARTYALLLKALETEIKDANIYNNLAWGFAIRRMYPLKTIEAAKKAQELAPEDINIMDTLAESYYAAGDYAQAVSWEKKVLKTEPKNEFFKKQLKKFEKALTGKGK